MSEEQQKRIDELEEQLEQVCDEREQAQERVRELEVRVEFAEDEYRRMYVEIEELESETVDSKDESLHSLIERSYALDPAGTEYDLMKLGLGEWVAGLRVDVEVGLERLPARAEYGLR